MVIIINGTLGVGKTWVARHLLSLLNDAAYIEGDHLGFVSPSLILHQSRQQYILDVALDLIDAHRRKGAKTIIFDNIFADSVLLNSFMAKVGEPTHVFYLSASPDTLISRIQKRGRPQADYEIKKFPEIENLQRTTFSSSALGSEIKTDLLSPEEVADQIRVKVLPR